MASQSARSAVLILDCVDTVNAGVLALTLHGVEGATADPERGQLRVRYDPDTIAAQIIRRAVRPANDGTDAPVRLLLSVWPNIARALPVAVRFL